MAFFDCDVLLYRALVTHLGKRVKLTPDLNVLNIHWQLDNADSPSIA